MEPHPYIAVDALLPAEMAEKAERIGADKTRLDTLSLLALSVLAGVFIAFGALFSLIVAAGAEGILPFGVTRLLAGVVFSLGLILVIVGGAELFTGNNLMVMACAGGKVGAGEVLRAWGLVYAGNYVGAAATALLVFLAEDYLHGSAAVGSVALATAQGKASLSVYQSLIHGILGNILVCLAVWLCYSARTTTDKVLVIVPPVSAFVAAGFEHSVANMFLLPFGLMIKIGAPASFWAAVGQSSSAFGALTPISLITNIVPVTIGNMIGGVMVGVTYWFIYLRKH